MKTPLSVKDDEAQMSERFQSRPVPGTGCRIHTFGENGEWEVWLNMDADFDGQVIGQGPTREVAEANAVEALQAIMLAIVEPVKELDGGA